MTTTKEEDKTHFSMTEPQKSVRTGKFPNHPARKVVASTIATGNTSEKKETFRNRVNNDASLEELDKMLEDDALALLNIKKDLSQAQEDELRKLQISIMQVKKEHDQVYMANNIKDRELQAMLARFRSLSDVDRANTSTASNAKSLMHELTDQTAVVLDDLAAEQRTVKMQTLMIKRLDAEIGQCRVDIAKALIAVEHAKHDQQLAEANLQVNRQDLTDTELALDKLQNTMKVRKDQRDNKINMLHNISVEGESSMVKLQKSLMESTKRALTAKNRKTTAHAKLAQTKNNNDEDEFGEMSDIAARAKRMTLVQIKEALLRFQTQSSRMERLQQLDQELRHSITHQLRKKQELSEHLTQTQFKIQQLASNRQIYQEVDLKDSALAATSKECEEAKNRDFRLRLDIEELKQSIPRFLTKITKVVHPKTSENMLGDAVLKLEDELVKLIKVIGAALLKDATPDDLAIMAAQNSSTSNNTNDNQSEFARLQRLPGFSRMKRQLFFNLMTARPDVSEQNIRIDFPNKPKAPAGGSTNKGNNANNNGSVLGSVNNASVLNDGSVVSPRAKRGLQQQSSQKSLLDNDLLDGDDGSLDRTTIKNISKLIYDRDHLKALSKQEQQH